MGFLSRLFGGVKPPPVRANQIFFETTRDSVEVGGPPIIFKGLTITTHKGRGGWQLNAKADANMSGIGDLKDVVVSFSRGVDGLGTGTIQTYGSTATLTLPPELKEGDEFRIIRG